MQPDATALSACLRSAGVAGASFEERHGLGPVCRVAPGEAPAALRALRDGDDFALLVDVFGADTGEDVEITYHLRSFVRDEDLFVKSSVEYGGELSSVWDVYPGANFSEREAAEMFGLRLTGHPNPKRLLTTEASGAPLLLKSTEIRTHEEVHDRTSVTKQAYEPGPITAFKGGTTMPGAPASAAAPPMPGMPPASELDILLEGMLGVPVELGGVRHAASGVDGLTTEHLVLNMGPQHPSTHGVLHVMIELDGEEIVATEIGVGFLHRGIEKLAEHRRYNQLATLLDRGDYLSGNHGEHALAMAAEQLLEIEAPPKAQWLRSLLGELTRIGSHLIFYGTYGLDAGGMGQFLYAVRERELLLNMIEELTGARMMFNYVRPGGVLNDLPPGLDKRLIDFADLLDRRIDEYHELLTGNEIFQARIKDIGHVDKAAAIAYGATGPTLRAAGLAWDVRKERPYGAYPELEFAIPVGTTGDCWDRYMVRMEELRISADLVRQMASGMPEGPHMAAVPKVLRVPAGEAYACVECPRGELGIHLYSDGGDKPYRMRMRSPALYALQLSELVVPGHLVADGVVIIASFDIVLGEIDR